MRSHYEIMGRLSPIVPALCLAAAKLGRLFSRSELIQEGCIRLRLPQLAMATASILFHRFYFKVSFKHYDVEARPPTRRFHPAAQLFAAQIASMTCLFLASKREECSPPGRVQAREPPSLLSVRS